MSDDAATSGTTAASIAAATVAAAAESHPAATSPQLYGAAKWNRSLSLKFMSKRLNLPIPWHLRWKTAAIEDAFLDGAIEISASLEPDRLGFAMGTEATAGLTTWLLVSRSGWITCIITGSAWTSARAHRLLLRLRDESSVNFGRLDFLESLVFDPLDVMHARIDSLTCAMESVMDAAVERGACVDALGEATQNLTVQARRFQKEAMRAQRCCFGRW